MPPYSVSFCNSTEDDYSMYRSRYQRSPSISSTTSTSSSSSSSSSFYRSNVMKRQPLSSKVAPVVSPSSSTTSKKSRISKRANVSFAERPQVVEIPHHRDIPRDVKEKVWLSRDHLRDIRKACLRLVARLNSRGGVQSGECTRGVEQYQREYAAQRRRAKQCANEAVFGMQKFHRTKGVSTGDLMAELYGNYTKQAQELAHLRGLSDEEDSLCNQ